MPESSAKPTRAPVPEEEHASKFPMAQRLAGEAARNEEATLLRFFRFHDHLSALLQAAEQERLHLIVLKGAALAETVYPRPGLRPFGDLDVLVRPSEAVRARALLESLGFVVDPVQWSALVSGDDCQANFFKDCPAGGDAPPAPVVVELHTDLINNDLLWGGMRVAASGIWERTHTARLAGSAARVLGPEDQLLHLCLHLAGHYLAAPQSLRDIHQVCGSCAPDWPLFVRLAREARAAAACFAGLLAAAALLGTPIPPTVLDALAPRRGRHILERGAVVRASDVTQADTEHLRFPLLWLLLEGRRLRLAALWRVLFPSPRWLAAHYYHDLFDDADPPAFPKHAGAGDRAPQARVLRALRRAHRSFLLRSAVRVFRHLWPSFPNHD